MSYKYFPPASIHVAIVDPGVGGTRKPLLVVTEDHYFIGPDNGIFTPIFKQKNLSHVMHISSSHLYLPQKGPTFHGRDIFAPVAAWLSKGAESIKLGKKIKDYITLSTSDPRVINRTTISGEVTYIDSFGNVITNITNNDLTRLHEDIPIEKLRVIYKGKKLNLANYYEEQKGLGLSAILNSFEFLELFLYKGNASEKFNIHLGDKVNVVIVK
jgi:S-adenosylmethionine hydrolase